MNYKNPVDEEKKWVNLLVSIANPDLLDEQDRKQELIDEVLSRVVVDVLKGDVTAIEELLRFTPQKRLLGFLDEERAAELKLRLANPFPSEDKS